MVLPLNMENSSDISACANHRKRQTTGQPSDASGAFNDNTIKTSGAHLRRSCSAMASPCCPAACSKSTSTTAKHAVNAQHWALQSTMLTIP